MTKELLIIERFRHSTHSRCYPAQEIPSSVHKKCAAVHRVPTLQETCSSIHQRHSSSGNKERFRFQFCGTNLLRVWSAVRQSLFSQDATRCILSQSVTQSHCHNLDSGPLYNMDGEAIASTIEVMRMQEANYKCHDYFSHRRHGILKCLKVGSTVSVPVDEDCRFKMAEWYYKVVDLCKFSRETVAVAMSYLDRYISTEAGRPALDDYTVYQLAGMTCLYTAIKIHEPEAITPAQLSSGTYTNEQVTDMELLILAAIRWHMNPPVALSFINNFLALLPSVMSKSDRDAVYELAKFQTELAVIEYSLITVDASTVAFAAILNALETIECTGSMKIMNMLAKFSTIDLYSSLVTETQDKLYHILRGISLTGTSVINLEPKSPVLATYSSCRESHLSRRLWSCCRGKESPKTWSLSFCCNALSNGTEYSVRKCSHDD